MAATISPSTPTSHIRGTPAVTFKRNYTPYMNFDCALPSHAHPEPGRSLDEELAKLNISPSPPTQHHESAAPASKIDHTQHSHPPSFDSTWIHRGGHGSRHRLDTVDFSLWDKSAHKYRNMTQGESSVIGNKYSAITVQHQMPFVIVVTRDPPNPLPLTIACAPALFVSPETEQSGWSPLLINANTTYASPRIKDPAPDNKRKPWANPTQAEIELVAEKLCELANVKTLNFSYPFLLVELRDDDGRSYLPASLPGTVGGWTTTYHHGGDFWKPEVLARDRDTMPSTVSGVEDTTDYLSGQRTFISPGVRLEGQRYATSCGVRVRKRNEVRVTASHHGFTDTDEVWHPDGNGLHIGTIQERFEAEDVVLFSLQNPLLDFKNEEYFAAEPPKGFMGYEEDCHGKWFEVDGMSTGLVQMFQYMSSHELPLLDSNATGKIPYWTFKSHNAVYAVTGAVGGVLVNGVCGAPIVSVDDGRIAGFFHIYLGGGRAKAPTLDKLMDEGWVLHTNES